MKGSRVLVAMVMPIAIPHASVGNSASDLLKSPVHFKRRVRLLSLVSK